MRQLEQRHNELTTQRQEVEANRTMFQQSLEEQQKLRQSSDQGLDKVECTHIVHVAIDLLLDLGTRTAREGASTESATCS